jgi:hypothetical protein
MLSFFIIAAAAGRFSSIPQALRDASNRREYNKDI